MCDLHILICVTVLPLNLNWRPLKVLTRSLENLAIVQAQQLLLQPPPHIVSRSYFLWQPSEAKKGRLGYVATVDCY